MNTLSRLTFDSGEDNMSGTLEAWYIPYDDLFAFPQLLKLNTSMNQISLLVGDFIAKPYKRFLKLAATKDTGRIDEQKLDLKDQNTYESHYLFMLAKINAETIGFQRISASSKFVFLIKEADGNIRSLGMQGIPAVLSDISSTSGRITEQKQAMFDVLSHQAGPAPIYLGSIYENDDFEDMSYYPMRFTTSIVTSYNADGLPLVTDFYYMNTKVFTWTQEWTNLVITRHQVQVHV